MIERIEIKLEVVKSEEISNINESWKKAEEYIKSKNIKSFIKPCYGVSPCEDEKE